MLIALGTSFVWAQKTAFNQHFKAIYRLGNYLRAMMMLESVSILKKTNVFGAILLSATITMGCQENLAPNQSNKTDPAATSALPEIATDANTNDGVYAGSKNISGLVLSATLTINGSHWSAVSQLDSGSPEHQTGIIKGNDLYDDSGLIKIGYASADSARIEGYPPMHK